MATLGRRDDGVRARSCFAARESCTFGSAPRAARGFGRGGGGGRAGAGRSGDYRLRLERPVRRTLGPGERRRASGDRRRGARARSARPRPQARAGGPRPARRDATRTRRRCRSSQRDRCPRPCGRGTAPTVLAAGRPRSGERPKRCSPAGSRRASPVRGRGSSSGGACTSATPRTASQCRASSPRWNSAGWESCNPRSNSWQSASPSRCGGSQGSRICMPSWVTATKPRPRSSR